MSQKGRFCQRKEGFIFLYSFAFAYICYEMNKLRNDFLSTKGRFFFSTKGRFYLRKEGFIIVYIVVLTYICYKINKLRLSTKGRFLSTKGSFIYERKIFVGPR